MMTMRKRPESRTRTLRMDGREWRVEERADRVADREERLLVFSTDGESRELQNYHWLWFGFTDEELVKLCKSRRAAAETTMAH